MCKPLCQKVNEMRPKNDLDFTTKIWLLSSARLFEDIVFKCELLARNYYLHVFTEQMSSNVGIINNTLILSTYSMLIYTTQELPSVRRILFHQKHHLTSIISSHHFDSYLFTGYSLSTIAAFLNTPTLKRFFFWKNYFWLFFIFVLNLKFLLRS